MSIHMQKKNLLLIFFLAVFAGTASAADLKTFTARVVGVVDGDTVDVLTAERSLERIRLTGIDAPEKSQAFGQRSKQHLSDLVFGKTVRIEWAKRDRNKRIVGRILISGNDANLEIVKAGLAWHYKQYEREQRPEDRLLYADAETAARKKKNGLWADPNPISPWDYRRARRK